MATMHKFKMLATQCAIAGSPTRSPSTSPVIHLRRRKTLRMLLSRGGDANNHRRLPDFLDRRGSDVDSSSEDEKDNGSRRRKLKDLFVTSSVSSSSSSPPQPVEEIGGDPVNRWSGYDCDLVVVRRGGSRGGVRVFPGSLRQRLLRRAAWRPVLVTIPE